MANLLKYNFKSGKSVEESFEADFPQEGVNETIVKECVLAFARNQRQWSACTQGRSEVRHSQKKPHKQKGTGNARQGDLAAPQYRGGGVVFGPKPKFNQHVQINRKERQLAISQLLSDRFHNGKVAVLDGVDLKAPKTKEVASFLEKSGLFGTNVLILAKRDPAFQELNDNLYLSMRNVCNDKRGERKKLNLRFTDTLNVHDLVLAQQIVLFNSLEDFKQLVENGKIEGVDHE